MTTEELKDQIITILEKYKVVADVDYEVISSDLEKLFQQTYLNDCIEKAAPNLSKIEEKQESFKLNRCKGSGFPIAIGNDYCSECMCEDDCAPD